MKTIPCYKIKNEIKEEQLIAAGFQCILVEGTDQKYFYCVVPQPLGGELAQGSLHTIYANPEWKKKFYDKHSKMIKKQLGLEYGKDGNPIMNAKFMTVLTRWRVEFDFNEKALYFKSLDPWDAVGYIHKDILDKYCGKLISELNELKFIEESEVEMDA